MPLERAFSRNTESLADLKRLYDQAALLARLGAWECHLATERLTWTNGVFDLFAMPRGVAPRRAAIVDMYVGASRSEMETLRAEAVARCGSFSLDAQIRTRQGDLRWMRLTADVASADGRAVRIFGAKQDITHERALWTELQRLAACDPLTGLANRRTFEDRCREVIRAGVRPGQVAALALVDLDRFKPVNDRFGHNAGDACLREVAGRLARAFDPRTLVARLGGDEFAVLFRDAPSEASIRHRLERALLTIGRPFLWSGRRIDLGASIGVTMIARSRRCDVGDLLSEADSALYAAKASGRNAVRTFGDAEQAVPASPMPALRVIRR